MSIAYKTIFVLSLLISLACTRQAHTYQSIKFEKNSVKRFGAIGDGKHDDSRAFQSALDAFANGTIDKVWIPRGQYRITKELTFATTGYQRGLTMQGTGESSSIVFDSSCRNCALLKIDGSLRPYQFQRGGSLSDFSITAKRKKRNQHGISITAWFFWKIEALIIKSMGGNGLEFPLREDIDTNPDAYASCLGQLVQTEISFCDAWGLYAGSGIGFGGNQILHCRIGENKGGGIMLGGHQNRIAHCSIFSNGKSSTNVNQGGIFIQRVQANSNHNAIEFCELDNNKAYHIKIAGAAGAIVKNNRMNSWESVFKDGQLSPAVHVLMVNEKKMAKTVNIFIQNNFHRSQNTSSGAKKNHSLVLYDCSNDVNVSNVDIQNLLIPADNTPNIKVLSGINPNTIVSIDNKDYQPR